MNFKFSNHALAQMARRGIEKTRIVELLNNPDKIIEQDEEVHIFSKVVNEHAKIYLYRVFINVIKEPPLIITVYKTSKLEKYGYSI